ncbi:Copper-sensitive operon repressor [uncultured Clostridium sp.]|nr:Copper-sensitive operon repressor [uncultured Clostridium sp.]
MKEQIHTHTHIAPDGTVYEHTHTDGEHSHLEPHTHEHSHEHSHEDDHVHGHGHTHTHQNTKAVLNRLSRAIGHMESIKRMVEDGRDCSEVLVQLSAVKAAINNTAKVILKDHIEHCMVDAVESGDHEAIEELTAAIDRFIK